MFGTMYKNQIFCFEPPLVRKKRFRDVFIFDFHTNTWTSRDTNSKNQQYPDDRQYVSLAFSGNVGFMSGGIRPFNTYWTSCDIWRIDLENLEWLKLEYYLKTSVYDHRMCVVDDNYLYSFGGYHDEGSNDTLECFTVQPPRLYRLCLESFSHLPNLRKYNMSLPPAIVDELNFNNKNSSFYR
ncbi:hypothetical protein RF11_04651 [Thelohanellus kitauei]|uniref:Kelch domain-containing protein 10 n=1 Tax=Thelohanellus kitauei TaxID=669202 RepID=A0A0C2NLU3_THEKT|nr:hypothetical protein RF11_04651 [Thelohanellus kitauei]